MEKHSTFTPRFVHAALSSAQQESVMLDWTTQRHVSRWASCSESIPARSCFSDCSRDSWMRPDCGLQCSVLNRGPARVNEAESSGTSAQGVQSQAITTALNLCYCLLLSITIYSSSIERAHSDWKWPSVSLNTYNTFIKSFIFISVQILTTDTWSWNHHKHCNLNVSVTNGS